MRNLPVVNSRRKHTQGFVLYTDFSPLLPREVAFPSKPNGGQTLPSGVTASSAAERTRRFRIPRAADRGSHPFLSPSAHGRRRARGAQTKARAVGPTAPGRTPFGPQRPSAPRPTVPVQLCKRKAGRRRRPQVRVRPGRPACAWAAGEGARGGRGAPRPNARRRPQLARRPWLAPGRARPTARPTLSPRHGRPPRRTAACTRPLPGPAAGPGASAGLPRSSVPRSGQALAAPPSAAAKLSPHRGRVASRPPWARQSVGREVGRRVPPLAPPRAPDLVRLRFIVVVLGAHGHGHGSWWAQARAR